MPGLEIARANVSSLPDMIAFSISKRYNCLPDGVNQSLGYGSPVSYLGFELN